MNIDINQLVPSQLERVVAFIREDDHVQFFQRQTSGELTTTTIATNYWIFLQSSELLKGCADVDGMFELNGELFFSALATFSSEKKYRSTLKFLKMSTGFTPSAMNAPFKTVSDLEQQVLSSSQIRLFSGMKFDEVLRMQIDLEVRTTPGFSFPNAEREGDAIIMIAMRDSSGWERLLSLDEIGEAEMLQTMVGLINERNPDVLEGHNFFNFDLPYIEKRAKLHKIKLNIGRNGKPMKGRKSRFNVAERTLDYNRYDVPGRHVVDTLHLVQLYDVIKREFSSYGLKAVAKYFNVAAENRTYVEGDKITELFDTNPEELKRYAMDDVRETDAISRILSPSFFYQSQLIPLTYQNCIVRGNATRIEGIFLAHYLNSGHSLPQPNAMERVAGGLTESFHAGVFDNVWHADVRSLYPSIIIAEGLQPANDKLGVFSNFLSKLRLFRLEAKEAMQASDNPADHEFFGALQSTFKILINSFYGYLGFSFGTFNDFTVAAQVTSRGREILTSMHNRLIELGAKVIEMDTDGLYFQPAKDYTGNEEDMRREIQKILPEGIEVELDAVYQAMFGYKSKNYALLHQDGRISLAGAALKSRGHEPFQRTFLHEMITLLLNKESVKVNDLFDDYCTKIKNHQLPLSQFVKSETLSQSVKAYRDKLIAKKGRRAASYELASKAEQEFRQGDQIKFYVTGTKKRVSVVENSKLFDPKSTERDENVLYYQTKLEELFKKFSDFIEQTESNQLELF